MKHSEAQEYVMHTDTMVLELITYGLGDKLYPEKISRIKNDNFIKPKGGLWASPLHAKFGWREWCKSENFGDLTSSFKFTFAGNILKVDSLSVLDDIPWGTAFRCLEYPDFEELCKNKIDAVWLTDSGFNETHLSMPRNLYGWDCECVLIMNPQGIEAD